MAKKKHIYFREDTQELKELPITEMNCYYLGEFTELEIKKLKEYLDSNTISFRFLSEKISNNLI